MRNTHLFILTALVLTALMNMYVPTPETPVILGALGIVAVGETVQPVVFDTVIEDWVGGAIVARSTIATNVKWLQAGCFLYINEGLAIPIKSSIILAGTTATALRVKKNQLWKVGDFLMQTVGSDSVEITAIDTTAAEYDVLTIATLGSTLVAGNVVTEATNAGASGVLKYVPNAILQTTTNVEEANNTVSGVVRGSVRTEALPYGTNSDLQGSVTLIRFV